MIKSILPIGLVLLVIADCVEAGLMTGEGAGSIIARVNGQPVFASQMKVELQRQMRKHKNASSALVDRVRKQVLDEVIDRELLYQAARELDIRDLEQKISEELQSTRDRFRTEERFQRYLASNGLTQEQLWRTARRVVFIEEYLREKKLLAPAVTEEEIRDFYRKKTFKREEALHLRHILLSVEEDDKPEKREEIRYKAEEIRRMIDEGANFAMLAAQFSDSAEAKEAGGDLGFVKRGYMPMAVDEVVFSLREGEVSKVIETRFGFHIIKVVARRSAGMIPYAEVRDFIKRYLQNQRRQELVAAHIEELRAQASIEILSVNKRPLARRVPGKNDVTSSVKETQ
ncbi:peptidylprolyl isomerase [Thiolapillus sp.]